MYRHAVKACKHKTNNAIKTLKPFKTSDPNNLQQNIKTHHYSIQHSIKNPKSHPLPESPESGKPTATTSGPSKATSRTKIFF